MYESGENYLETILILYKKNGNVKSIDIARELNFSKPSVSRAVGLLKSSGYILVDDSGDIKLTELGRKTAESIYERHKLITEFLIETLKVSKEVAEENACKMEHIISQEVFDGIKDYIGNLLS